MAGLAFTIPLTTGSHACSFPLTNIHGIPHGEACGITLDYFAHINANDPEVGPRCFAHFFSCLYILRVFISSFQIFEYQITSMQCNCITDWLMIFAPETFYSMAQYVNPAACSYFWWAAVGQFPRMNDFAQKLGFRDMNVMADEIHALKARLGLRNGLKDLNLNEEQIADLVRISVHPNLRNNPVYITDEMLDEMYHYLATQN